MRISEQHVDHWRKHGYTVVQRFVPPAELHALQAEVRATLPTWDEYIADQYSPMPRYYATAPGGGYLLDVPALPPRLNLVGAHPDLIDFVERALGTRDVILSQSQLWGKYSGYEDFDQALHTDYMNSSILYPSSSDAPEHVSAILYYVDVLLDLGPTYVIPRDRTRDVPLVPYIRPRDQYPEFYSLEQPVLAPAGSILLYDLRTFHRGSAITRPRGNRFSHHIAYRRADAQWVGYQCWAVHGLTEELQELLESATPRQREVFGVPAPGHAYWTAETVAGMAARYPKMDMRPYAEAAGVPQSVLVAERSRMKKLPPISDVISPIGVTTRLGHLRQSIRAMRPYLPTVAAYYEGMLDVYEAASVRETERAEHEKKQE